MLYLGLFIVVAGFLYWRTTHRVKRVAEPSTNPRRNKRAGTEM